MVANELRPGLPKGNRAAVFSSALDSHEILEMREVLARESDQINAGPGGGSGVTGEVKPDRPKQALLFRGGQSLFGCDSGARIAFSDFDENERVSLAGDDVDLSAPINDVSGEDFVAIFE